MNPATSPSESGLLDGVDVGSGLAATGRSLVQAAARIAPGLASGIAVVVGSSGAWRILASTGEARDLERVLRAALPDLRSAASPLVRVAPREWTLRIAAADGPIVGCLLLVADHDRELPATETDYLSVFAREAADAIGEARRIRADQLDELGRAAVQALPRLALAAPGTDDVLKVFGSIVEYALPGCVWAVGMRGTQAGPLRIVASTPGSDDRATRLLGRTAQRAIEADDVVVDLPGGDSIALPGTHLALAAPLHDRRARRVGAVAVHAPIDGGIEYLDQAAHLGVLCDTLSLALELVEQTRMTRILQRQDPTTGCLSPDMLGEAVATVSDACNRSNRSAALLLLQPELGATVATTTLADAVGTSLLRLSEDPASGELVIARLRPWQYAILASDHSRRDAALLAARIRLHLRTPLPDHGAFASSVGIAMIPQHGSTSDSLLHAASGALDEALATGNCERIALGSRPVTAVRSGGVDSGQRLLMLQSIAELIDDLFFGGTPHSEAVSQRARELCLRLGVAQELLGFVTLAGKLHDVGRALLPPSLFAAASPTEQERRLIQTHVVLGARLVSNAGFPRAAESIANLHERWDGAGEPNRRAGTDIPLGARILAVVNTFETVLNGLGRGDRGLGAAITTIARERGRSLDPEVVDGLLATLQDPPVGSGRA